MSLRNDFSFPLAFDSVVEKLILCKYLSSIRSRYERILSIIILYASRHIILFIKSLQRASAAAVLIMNSLITASVYFIQQQSWSKCYSSNTVFAIAYLLRAFHQTHFVSLLLLFCGSGWNGIFSLRDLSSSGVPRILQFKMSYSSMGNGLPFCFLKPDKSLEKWGGRARLATMLAFSAWFYVAPGHLSS